MLNTMGKLLEPAAGRLLIAHPWLPDPNFRRAVVLLCEHEDDQGSYGLILNRPLPFLISEVVEEPLRFDARLFAGGPVQRDTLHIIHTHGELIDASYPVTDHLYRGGELEDIQGLLCSKGIDHPGFRFFVGYSGWGPGQLMSEFEAGDWVVAPARFDFIFETPPEELWKRALKMLGGEYAVLAHFPADPRLN